jgi:excisionase family DNA binding protein
VIEVGEEALDLLTVEEVAKRLRCSPKTVGRLISSGELESVKIGTLRRVAPEALRAYKERLRSASKPTAPAA